MSRAGGLLAIVLIIVGAITSTPGLSFAGFLVGLTSLLTELWSRYGLRRVRYERRLANDRAVWGDEIGLDVSAWNDKPLPLAWLAVDDYVSEEASILGDNVQRSERPGLAILRSVWTIGWFERAARHLSISANRRGTFEFQSVRLSVADLFGQGAAAEEHAAPLRWIVRPRSVPVRSLGRDQHALDSLTARHSLFEDPSLFAGVRPYQPGDPIRRIHWRATARTGAPVSKRFDPSRTRDVLIALDVQTVAGPHWALHFDEDVLESLIVAALSLARHAVADGAAVGLAAAGYTASLRRLVFLPPRGGEDQLATIADFLGRLSEVPSAPFEHLLASLPPRLVPGTTIVVLSGRDPAPFGALLRRLDDTGYPVEFVAMGADAESAIARVRAFGLGARRATLTPDWRTGNALVLAG
ncbi:MAG: DUF58 domain-containing protein [Chloroflexi bacterium]|nr:DUF58 domain-containing protein [Chloroflexota bacterium]